MPKQAKDGRYRQIINTGVKGTWIRDKRYGQVGYREPLPEPAPEKYVPVERGPNTPLVWRSDEHGPFQVRSGHALNRDASRTHRKYGRKSGKTRPASPAPEVRPERSVSPRLTVRPAEERSPTAPRATVTSAIEPEQAPPLPVPIPSERVRQVDVAYASREGQAEFRASILAAYGRCAVTGCQVEAVLQAAHIIPYVDARSNLISNGLCLRADIHCLYDRNLIRIAGDGGIVVDEAVGCPEYRELHGRQIITPEAQANKPNPALMNVRHEYV